MAEFRLRLGVGGGRTAYPPSGEPRGGLLRAAPLARHRVEAPAMPVVGVSVRNIRHPGVRASNESRLYCHRLAREGISVTIFPNRPQAGLISEPWGKPASEGTYTCWPRNVSGSAGAGAPMGRCRLIGTRGLLRTRGGLGYGIHDAISSRKHLQPLRRGIRSRLPQCLWSASRSATSAIPG